MDDLKKAERLAKMVPPGQSAGRVAVWHIATASVFLALAALLATETLWFTRPSPAAQTPGPDLRNELVDLGDHVLGDKSMASVGVVEFGDFQCPYCGRFVKAFEPVMLTQYVKPGRVLWAFRQLPLEAIHVNARRAAGVADCAGEQGRFWAAHDYLYDHQADLLSAVERLAQALRLDEKQFAVCMAGRIARVDRDLNEASRLRISTTPTFLIGTLVGTKIRVEDIVVGLPQVEAFRAQIDETLRGSQRPVLNGGR
jgi:protein-disulfide isomerase